MKSTVKFRNLPSFPGSDAVNIVIVDGDEIGELSQAPYGTYGFTDYSEGEDFYLSSDIGSLKEAQDAVTRLLRRIGYVEEV